MQIKLLQTADPECYKVLFDITSRASRRFCDLHHIAFEPYIGIRRGYYPWHATFNRIPLLHDLAEARFRGWAIYLDADAYPFDMNFDVRAYLAANANWGIIAASGHPTAHLPNNGIMLLNFAHPGTRDIVAALHDAFEHHLPNATLREKADWAEGGDQALLHPILHARADIADLLKIESFDLIAWPRSRFLRQHLKQFGSFRDRCERALAGVTEALATAPAFQTGS